MNSCRIPIRSCSLPVGSPTRSMRLIPTWLTHSPSLPFKPDQSRRSDRSTITGGNNPSVSIGVLPYARRIEGALAVETTVRACSGEFEPISIALWSPENIQQVSARASDLTGGAGAIPAANLDIKVVGRWYHPLRSQRRSVLISKFLLNDDTLIKTEHSKQRNYLKLQFPDGVRYAQPRSYLTDTAAFEEEVESFPIRDADELLPFDLIGGQNKQVWITLKVPDDAAAGRYEGNLTFTSRNRSDETRRRGVAVLIAGAEDAVRPKSGLCFRLLRPRKTNARREGQGGLSIQNRETVSNRNEDDGRPRRCGTGSIAACLGHTEKMLRRELQIMREFGFAGRHLYLGRGVGNARTRRASRSFGRTFGSGLRWPRSTDSPASTSTDRTRRKGKCFSPKSLRGGRCTRRAERSMSRSCTIGWTRHPRSWTPSSRLAGRAGGGGRPASTWAHDLKLRVSPYEPARPSSVPALRSVSVELRLRLRDAVLFHAQLWRRLNDHDAAAGDFNIAYPTVDGAIGTLALEAFREGADDVRYATLLMQRIERARRKASPETKATAEEAFQWIEREAFLIADLDRVRDRMIVYILALGG